MPAKAATFKPVGDTAERMHGQPAVITAGFTPAEQGELQALLSALAMPDVVLIFASGARADLPLAELAALDDGTGLGEQAKLPRAIVMSGLTEQQFNRLMGLYRASELPQPLWAAVTPHSASWSLRALLVELVKEREALRAASQRESAQ
jgi:hypothetical protein